MTPKSFLFSLLPSCRQFIPAFLISALCPLVAQTQVDRSDADAWWEDLKGRSAVAINAQERHDVADDFRDFQIRNPGHPQVGNARRLEALSLIGAWQAGDDSKRSRREQTVAAIRNDLALPVDLRAEVAATADNVAVNKRRYENDGARIKAYAQVARSLAEEFPTWDRAYESLVRIARVSDPADARSLLAQVRDSERASERIKAMADAAEQRFALVGEALEPLLRPQDQTVFAKLPQNAPALLYTWSVDQPWSLQKAVLLYERVNPQTAFLGICLDRTHLDDSRRTARLANLPGSQLYEGPTAGLADALLLDAPGVGYLVDGQGRIAAVSLSAKAMTELGMLDSLK